MQYKKVDRLVLALSDEMLFFLGDFLGFPDKELKIILLSVLILIIHVCIIA